MKSILTIVKKELARVFTNKKLIAMLFVPGILVYIMYTSLGVMIDKLMDIDPTVIHEVHIVNHSDSLDDYFESFAELEVGYTIKFEEIQSDSIDEYKQKIVDNDVKVLIVLDEKAKAWFDTKEGNGGNVEVFYNGDSIDSMMMHSYLTAMFQLIEEQENDTVKFFSVNSQDKAYNLAGNSSANPFTAMLPMLLLTFLISGVTAIAVESIAGEKERGTLATILMTPISRFKLALGKVLSLAIPATISGLASFLGLVLSLPNLAGEFELVIVPSMYIALAFVIFITVLVFVVLIALISALAKSVKEAGQLVSPFMIIVMVAALVVGFVTINSDLFYCIPVLNSILAIRGSLNASFTLVQFILVLVSNLGVIGLGVFGLGKMFGSEKIMFNKN